MKTTFTSWALAIAALFLVLGSCQKEQKPTPATEKTMHCDPWQNVTGWIALFDELNTLSFCDDLMCDGNSVTMTVSHSKLKNTAGVAYTFNSVVVIPPSTQTAVMNDALAWAVANAPAGYFVSRIRYAPNIIVGGGGSTSFVWLDIVYRKCTGGGGPQG